MIRAFQRTISYSAVLIALILVAACAGVPLDETPVAATSEATSEIVSVVAPEIEPATPTPFRVTTAVENPVASPPPSTPTPLPSPTPTIHIVQSGDTLSGIAARYGVGLAELAAANDKTISDGLLVGDTLIIPNLAPLPGQAADVHIGLVEYQVQLGDTLAKIATLFDISVNQLATFNAIENPNTILPGQVLQIPVGGHVVIEGNTLDGIAKAYAVSMDELIALNAGAYPTLPDQPGVILQGWLLKLPQQTVAEGYNCDPLSEPRTGVITHTVDFGMRLACLSTRFGVSVNTLVWANQDALIDGGLQDGDTMFVPPADGALYTISENDIASETSVEDLMDWYGVSDAGALQDWVGNPLTGALDEVGQQVFIRGADLLDGSFEPAIIVVAPTPFASGIVGGDGTFIPPSESTDPTSSGGYVYPSGDPPPGTQRPKTIPWLGTTILDTGLCDVVPGSGWGTPLVWPAEERIIQEGRGFDDGGNRHRGVDINGDIGSFVYSAAGGRVVWAGNSVYGYGNLIVLDHGGTFQTFYAHLQSVFVSCGQMVGPGEIIGTVGQTGLSTWPHLHFEVRYGGFNYNPRLYLP